MSYNSKNFSVMAYANGFTLWNYTTPDTLAVVKAANYFNETAPFARVGDMVMVNTSTGSTVESAIMAIKTIANDVVTLETLAAPTA